MSRFGYYRKEVVENCWSIDTRWLAKYGYFKYSQSGLVEWKNSDGSRRCSISISSLIDSHDSFSNQIRLQYTIRNSSTNQVTDYDYNIRLLTTRCNYGGVRYWLQCPLIRNGKLCFRRVRKLYLPPGARYFGCRCCHNLTYTIQREHDKSIHPYLKNPGLIQQLLNSENINKRLFACRAGLALFSRKCL
jgi:hypothetical protein